MSASTDAPEAQSPQEWPPAWKLPGLAARVLWRLCAAQAADLAHGTAMFVRDPLERRKLLVFPLVLLGHALLVWLLIQNRWLVMSEITVLIQPPVEASVVLVDAASPDASADNAITLAKSPDGLDLKNDDELGMNSLSVHSSVPWFNTSLLPDLRGTGQGRAAKREPKPVRKPTRGRKPPSELAEKPPEPALLPLPPPSEPRPEVAIIPPPPVPLPPTLVAPAPVPVPPIPAPVATGPREIPPLWTAPPAPPPPVLAVLPPAPVALPVPVQTPPPVAVPVAALPPPAAAAVTPPPKVAPVPPNIAPKAAPEPAPAPPLNLSPAPQLAVPTREAPVAPQIAADVTVKPVAPTVAPVSPAVSPPVAVPAAVVAAPAAEAPRNPMIVEVPRYTRTPADTPSGDGSFKPSAAADVPRQSGGRVGADAAANSSSGSALGLGVPAPAAPASAPATASGLGSPSDNGPPKQLNLSLPRVDPGRYGSGPIRQPSFSELANAQLRRGPAKDPMAEAVNNSEKADCLKDNGMGLLGAPVAAYQAATGKCK